MLNQARLHIAEDVAQEFGDHWDATEEFSRDEKGQAGFKLQLGKALRNKRRAETKVEKARTKVRCTKVSDSNPSVVSSKKRSVGLHMSTQRALVEFVENLAAARARDAPPTVPVHVPRLETGVVANALHLLRQVFCELSGAVIGATRSRGH